MEEVPKVGNSVALELLLCRPTGSSARYFEATESRLWPSKDKASRARLEDTPHCGVCGEEDKTRATYGQHPEETGVESPPSLGNVFEAQREVEGRATKIYLGGKMDGVTPS